LADGSDDGVVVRQDLLHKYESAADSTLDKAKKAVDAAADVSSSDDRRIQTCGSRCSDGSDSVMALTIWVVDVVVMTAGR